MGDRGAPSKTIEQALEQASGIFRDLLEAAPDALIVVDEAGDVIFVNSQTEALFGYSREELLGESVELLVPDRQRASHRSHREGYGKDPRVRPMGSELDLTAVRKDGTEFPVEISLSPHRSAGRLLVSAAIRDITHRVEVERELREARARAEQADRAKSRFLAAASHDLRQPLQAAILYNNVLARQVGESAHAETTAKLQSSLEALRDLLNRLLDISRLEAGAIAPQPMHLSLRILLERLLDEFSPQATEKGIELRVRPSDLKVSSDPQLLEQLLRNLVSNAVRYTESGGVLVGCRTRDGAVAIQVWDTGVGIPADQLETIFEEFYQVDNPMRRRQAGLGLGLAIVRRLSELLRHPVSVRSRLGRGTVFEVRVPLAPASAVRAVDPGREPRRGTRRRGLVAIIDDDPDVLDSLRLSLEVSGHEVIAAERVDQVMREIESSGRRPDVVISDYQLERKATGIEAIERLRRRLGVEIAGILITGDSSGSRIREARESGYPMLHKPVHPEELEELIGELLKGKARP